MSAIKVGARIWRFDENRRVYAKDDTGRRFGSPIWRKHWEEREIQGETSRSWLVGFPGTVLRNPHKLSKRGPWIGWAFSEEEIDRLNWMHLNRYRISSLLERCQDYAILRAVADMIGFEETP